MTYGDVTKQSPETQAAIEQEVRVLLQVSVKIFIFSQAFFFLDSFLILGFFRELQESYDRAKNLLKKYSKEHKTLADALLTHETLDAKEIQMVLEGKSLDH